MFGHLPRTVGEVFSDDPIDPVLVDYGTDLQKLAARRAAQKAYVEVNTSSAIKVALQSRGRTQPRFQPGEVVFVWRSWKTAAVLKPGWVGPAVVLLPEGANCYVNMRGRIWKVSNEHLRPGTSEEIRGIEAVHQVFDDLKQRFDRSNSRVIQDHTGDPLPERAQRDQAPGPDAEGQIRGVCATPREMEKPLLLSGSTRSFKCGNIEEETDDWRAMKPTKRSLSKWKGHTDFFLTKAALEHLKESGLEDQLKGNYSYSVEVVTAEVFKTANDEVLESAITGDEWEEWRQADAEEWAKIKASGAVGVLSKQVSAAVLKELERSGKPDRVMGSHIVRRRKPADQPGEPPSKKSRLVVKGFADPDLHVLEKYAPTVSTQNLNVVLQAAASLRLRGACGVLKQAFTQSDPLKRKEGRLFMWQPTFGLPGLEEGQLVEILHGVYGLVDAPLHWRRTLKTYLTETLQYKQSRLDPCIFTLYIDGKLDGVIVVEVDDLLAFGKEEHEARLNQLRQRFRFGKFHWLQQLPQGTSFNGRRVRQDQDFTVHTDMHKFVEERLEEVHLERGRRSKPEADATEKERGGARASIGSLAWAAKDGRPDAAATASIMASKMKRLKIRDLIALNKAIKEVKGRPDLTMSYYPIEVSRLGFGTTTDASFDNYEDGSSQGAVGVLAYDLALVSGEKARCSRLWRRRHSR